jgi:HSP20 family protein
MKKNPSNELFSLFSLQNRINEMFDKFYYPLNISDSDFGIWKWGLKADIYKKDDSLVIKAELPGVDKNDVQIDLSDRILTIKGERKSDNKIKEESYYRRETSFGKFERAFTLPVDVNSDQVKAEYKDGLLKIEIPKPEGQKPKQISIRKTKKEIKKWQKQSALTLERPTQLRLSGRATKGR